MILSIKVPDETYETYARRNPENPRVELERSLQAFASLDPKRVNLFLDSEELKEISTILGFPVHSYAELKEHLERSQRASFGEGLEISLNSGQRNRLKAMATAMAEEFKSYAERELKRGVIVVVGP